MSGFTLRGTPAANGARRARARATALLFAVVALSSCTAGHSALGSSGSACFKALPVATDAVDDKGTLLGVRELSARTVSKLPRIHSIAEANRMGNASICAVAFRGTFAAGEVKGAVENRAGHVAVVLVDQSGRRLLGSLVTQRVPLRFRHLI